MKLNKRIVISSIIVLVLAVGATYALLSSSQLDTDNGTNEQAVDEQNDENLRDDETSQVEKEEGGEVSKPETEEPEEQPAAEHTVTISSWGQQSDSKEVYVNALANGASSGTCTLQLSKGTQKVSVSTPLQQAPTGYYACALRVSRSQIPSTGTWIATVTLKNSSGISQSQSIEVEVE